MIQAKARIVVDVPDSPIPSSALLIKADPAPILIGVSAIRDGALTGGCVLSRAAGGVQVPARTIRPTIKGVSASSSEETVRDTLGEIAAAQTLARAASAAISRCVDLGELMDAGAHVRLERDEARHRLKNVYASAIGLANLSLPEEHSKEFSQRLRILAKVHDFLDKEDQGEPQFSLREVLAGVLFPYHNEEVPRILVEGPEINVSSTVAVALGLLANELATNALKYGSLSVGTGRILIQWTCRNGQLSLWWAEVDGPQCDGTASPNQGSKLLHKIVKSQLRGTMEHSVTRSGLRFSVLFPMD